MPTAPSQPLADAALCPECTAARQRCGETGGNCYHICRKCIEANYAEPPSKLLSTDYGKVPPQPLADAPKRPTARPTTRKPLRKIRVEQLGARWWVHIELVAKSGEHNFTHTFDNLKDAMRWASEILEQNTMEYGDDR